MPALYPGGGTTYLQLYGELHALGYTHGRDFRRRNGAGMGWYFEVDDEAYEAWLRSKATAAQPEAAAQPEPESGSEAEPSTGGKTDPSADEQRPAEDGERGPSRSTRSEPDPDVVSSPKAASKTSTKRAPRKAR